MRFILFLYYVTRAYRHRWRSDVGCKTVANMIKGKTPEEIRKLFNIVNDFTPEEEAQIKKENVSHRHALRPTNTLTLIYRNGQRIVRRSVYGLGIA